MRLKIDFSGGKINKINKVLDRQKKKRLKLLKLKLNRVQHL